MEVTIERNNIIQGSRELPIVLDFFVPKTFSKIIVFCHGYKGFKDWGAFNLMAQWFAAQGIAFCKFNFSHNGGTPEEPIDFPDLDAFSKNTYSLELADLDVVITHVHHKFNCIKPQVFAMGHSRGGGITLLQASKDKRLSGAITLAAVSDFSNRFTFDIEKWKQDGVAFVENGRTHQLMPHKYSFYEDFVANRADLDIPENLKDCTIPLCVIHGTKDVVVRQEHPELIKAMASDVEVHIIPATHTFNARHPWDKNYMPDPLQQTCDIGLAFVQKLG